jgi:hypothetical protein
VDEAAEALRAQCLAAVAIIRRSEFIGDNNATMTHNNKNRDNRSQDMGDMEGSQTDSMENKSREESDEEKVQAGSSRDAEKTMDE